MTSIGFIKSSPSTFIVNDIELLEKEFDVTVYESNISLTNPKKTIRSIFNIFKGVRNNNITYTWFASHHALVMTLLAKVLRKKSIVVIGGYEVENLKHINYGAMNKPISSFIVKSTMNLASSVITVSNYSKNKVLQYTNKNKVSMIYNSIPIRKDNHVDHKTTVTTVGSATQPKYLLKGLDLFASTSKAFPTRQFIIIGTYDEITKQRLLKISNNLIFTGPLQHEELLNILHSTKVYCQFSKVESFGMSILESISCNCVPLILDNGAMSEISKDLSIVTNNIDINKDLQKALNININTDIRNNILNKFSNKNRLSKLIKLINGVVK